MHKPNPYGTYPLVLRNYNTAQPRPGELLFDYNNNDIYVCNRLTGKVIPLAKLIYETSKAAMLENTRIVYSTESRIEKPKDRSINTFYLVGRGWFIYDWKKYFSKI